jgi:uncharacterized phage protein (TIGR02216 family)
MERFGDAAARLCNAAATLLGWTPGEFWEATPAELKLALESPAGGEGPDTATIEALKRRFPDESKS